MTETDQLTASTAQQVMAEALSLAIRGEDGPQAIASLRRTANRCPEVLDLACTRCRSFDLLDAATTRRAVSLLLAARADATHQTRSSAGQSG